MAENQASNSDTPADAGTAVNKTDNTAALTAIIKELNPHLRGQASHGQRRDGLFGRGRAGSEDHHG